MKSIHNSGLFVVIILSLVNSHVKIQFEINSQPAVSLAPKTSSCEFSRKNTIWNQFTTGGVELV